MAERPADPNAPRLLRRGRHAIRSLFTPLLPDDYLAMIDPLWSTDELRGRIERITQEADDAVTVVIKPGWGWKGHKPGQYLRVGVIVDGIHYWRAYSLTSPPEADYVSIAPKTVPEGKVSPYLNEIANPGTLVRLGGVQGDFTLPDDPPEKVLMISAGSGITPIMSMLRGLDAEGSVPDIVHLHSAGSRERVIFGDELEALEDRYPSYSVHLHLTDQIKRIEPTDLEDLCPDWRERDTYASGPGDLLDACSEHWEQDEGVDAERFNVERFQKKLTESDGEGGTVKFLKSEVEASSDGTTPILEVGENEGLNLDFGCREGICHTCTCELVSGRVRDLTSGKVHGEEGATIRICINAPEGPVEVNA
ncbi:MAG: ferredoxin reductase [Solirubrobacterales bacterium]